MYRTRSALVGASGFVGTTLLRQRAFEAQYRSTNIGEISGNVFDLVVCAGAPAQKWIANQAPDVDRANIEVLMQHLATIRCEQFVLISTVDVFIDSRSKHEASPVVESGLHPYGLHRRELEKFVERQFSSHLIVRLPGLVGPGLRKNMLYDLKHDNELDAVDSRAIYQFYPTVNLWCDLDFAMQKGLKLLHLTSAPTGVSDLAFQGFGRRFENVRSGSPALYDMYSIHADLFGGRDGYQYSKRDVIHAVRAYAQYS